MSTAKRASERKKNPKGTGTVFQRKDGRWEARITLGYDEITGKQKQKSVYGLTQAEAIEKREKLKASYVTGTYKEPCKMQLSEWLDTWAEKYIPNVKPSTAAQYKNNVRLYIKPILGNMRLDKITLSAVQTFINGLSDEKDSHKALSPKTVKDIHSTLHKALQQAVELSYLQTNPAAKTKLPPIPRQSPQAFTESQMREFWNALDKKPHEIFYKVALLSGMRKGEILGLTWRNIDFSNGTISITQQLVQPRGKGESYRITSLKNNKPRTIMPAALVMELLQQQKAKQEDLKAGCTRAGIKWEHPEMVFTNDHGGYLSHSVYDCYKRIVTSLDMPEMRLHDLRHTYTINALIAGDNPKTVQENLGHATPNFTLQVYALVNDDMKKQSAANQQRLFETILQRP